MGLEQKRNAVSVNLNIYVNTEKANRHILSFLYDQ